MRSKSKKILFAFLILILTLLINKQSVYGYVIGDEDVLLISVWKNPDLTVEIPVRPDGLISVPLIGDIKASGLSPQELKVKLEREFAAFIKTPTVSVIVTAVNSFKVYVVGEGLSEVSPLSGDTVVATTTPGVITLRKETTLLQLLAQLGSLRSADLTNAYILRNGNRLANDLYKLIRKGDISQDIQLQPDDTLFIPDNFDLRISVVGAVQTPTTIHYREGLSALDAIISAGGFTEFAKRNDVLVVRKVGEETNNIRVRLKDVLDAGEIEKDVPLKPGDLVIVKTGIF